MNFAIPLPGFAEPFSAWTHLFGCALALVAGYWLIRHARGRRSRVVSVLIFVFGAVLSMSMSGVYHMMEPGGAARDVMQRLDHACIWAIIAGTFTAFHGVLFRGLWGWGISVAVWVIASTAITLGTIYFEDMPEWLSLSLYIGVGWIAFLSTWKITSVMPWYDSKLILVGGGFYTVGAVIDFVRWPTPIDGVFGPHEIFHLFVLAGLATHWVFIERAVEHSRRQAVALLASTTAS